MSRRAHLGAIAELVRGQVDLAEAALADQLAQRVVADALEVCRREFTARMSIVPLYVYFGGLLEKLLVRICKLVPSVPCLG